VLLAYFLFQFRIGEAAAMSNGLRAFVFTSNLIIT
jgi:hypothetical protein